jgi:putative transposase
MTEVLSAEKGERTSQRLGHRSGYYSRTLVTRVGKLELRMPQDRAGRFSAELFARYQRSERGENYALMNCRGERISSARSAARATHHVAWKARRERDLAVTRPPSTPTLCGRAK